MINSNCSTHAHSQSLGNGVGRGMRLGLAGLEGPLPLLPPHAAHDGRDSRTRLLASYRCSSRRRSGLVPSNGAASALLALSPITTGAINVWKAGWLGGWMLVLCRPCDEMLPTPVCRCLLARCCQCVKVRPDEMSRRNEMKPAGAGEEEEKFRQQQQGQGPALTCTR